MIPFDDLTGEPDAKLYAQGIAETISIRLASLPGIQVIPPSAGGDVSGDFAARARRLGANLILRGSVRRSNENLRVNYHVIDPERGTQIAAGTVTGSMNDPFVVEDRLADSILHALELELGGERHRVSNRGILDAAAQDRYVQALGALQRYENQASVDLAIELLEEIHRQAPGSALAGAALGRAYLYKFQLTSDPKWADQAIETSESVIRLDPNLAEVHVTFGEVLTRLGRYDEAILRFRQALDQRPDSAPAMLGLAEALDRAGRDPDAKAMYERAIAARPLFWGGYNKLGVFHYRRGQLDEAEHQFRKVVSLTPDNTRALNNLGAISFSMGRFDEAAARFRESLALSETATGWSNLGTALYYLGDFSEAAGAFERATQMSPDNHLFWMNRGDALRWSRNGRKQAPDAYRRAIELAEAAIDRDPGFAYAYAVIAASHAKLGEEEQAREVAARALSLSPDDSDVLLLASITAHLGGRDEEAADLLRRALAAGGSAEIIRREPELSELRDRGIIEKIVRSKPNRT
ncbi:MAG: tetratricopeptide repeat protein [Acidobacteria bacterium]|nr:tetratricopeptide repeat protein [Acidobacteriota bacterium]